MYKVRIFKYIVLILIVNLMITGCIESGESLAEKYPDDNAAVQDNIFKEVTNTIIENTNVSKLPLEDSKILTMLLNPPAADKDQTNDVLYKAEYINNHDGHTMNFKLIAAYQLKNGNSLEEVNISKTPLAGQTKIKVRSLLVDAPEIKNKVSGQPDNLAFESKKFVQEKLKNANTIWLKHDLGDKQDKYSRELMHVICEDELLNVSLLEKGLAKIAYLMNLIQHI